jgi:PAP2 superfamily
MAWETWGTSSPERKFFWVTFSVLWLALFLLAARELDLTVPYLPLAIAGGFIFYLRSSPKVPELLVWVLLSLGFAAIVRFPHDHNWINTGSGALALFGLAAFFVLGLRCLWSEPLERRKTYAMLAPAASLVFFVLFAQRALNLANLLYPKTFDLYLYVFDGSLGFQPSFLMGRAMAASPLLRIAALLTYTSLPFVMALVYALRLPKGTERPSWDLITLFMLAGLGGWALYNLVPAAGPVYIFGQEFPWRALPYSMLHRLALDPIPVSVDVPRNAMPSLHMAWVLLLFWNTKGLSRALRIFMAVYVALTVVSTLGVGEHYFVDLVAGLPFALFVQAVVWPGDKPRLSVRANAAASGLGLTLAWLLLARFGVKWMLISPFLPWTLVVAMGGAVWLIKMRSSVLPNTLRQVNDGAPPEPLAFGAHV